MDKFATILVVGFGNMAGAMVDGWLASGIAPEAFTAVDPIRETCPEGVRLLRDIPRGQFDLVLLGVKPQMLAEVALALEPSVGPETTVLSMLAGAEVGSLAAHFPRAGAIVRIMPNLAAALGKSANSLFASGLDEQRKAAITALVERLGTAEWLDNEVQLHVVTALVGSGPGFVYRFIEALAEGGAGLGLDPATANRLAVQMVEGASALAAASDASPGELARRVASPGGTTQAGLDVLDDGQALKRLIAETLRAASNRSTEMAETARERG